MTTITNPSKSPSCKTASVACDREANARQSPPARYRSSGDTRRALGALPRAFVSAYPRGIDLGAVVVRAPKTAPRLQRYWEAAWTFRPCQLTPSPAPPAQAASISLSASSYATAALSLHRVFSSRRTALIGKHRKLMPTASEKTLVWGVGAVPPW